MTTRDFLRETIGLIALMIFLGGLFIFVAWMTTTLPAITQQQERCFENAIAGETYCRTQRQWEIGL